MGDEIPGERLVGWMGGADGLVDVLWVGVRMDAEVMADNG